MYALFDLRIRKGIPSGPEEGFHHCRFVEELVGEANERGWVTYRPATGGITAYQPAPNLGTSVWELVRPHMRAWNDMRTMTGSAVEVQEACIEEVTRQLIAEQSRLEAMSPVEVALMSLDGVWCNGGARYHTDAEMEAAHARQLAAESWTPCCDVSLESVRRWEAISGLGRRALDRLEWRIEDHGDTLGMDIQRSIDVGPEDRSGAREEHDNV